MLENALPNIEFELNDAHALMLSCLELVIYDYTQTHKPQKSSVKQSNLIPVYNPADVFICFQTCPRIQECTQTRMLIAAIFITALNQNNPNVRQL